MTPLPEAVQSSRERGLNAVRGIAHRSASLMKRQRRMASDYLGSLTAGDWEKVPGGYVTTIDQDTLPGVLRIYNEACGCASNGLFDRYSRIFSRIFYVAKFDAEVVGYSTYYVKLSPTLKGLRRCAVLYSMAVDGRHRRQGIGRQLLTVSIREMQLNGIDEIVLYVGKQNLPALSLYRKLGFVVIGELPDICKQGEQCYRMRLLLPALPA